MKYAFLLVIFSTISAYLGFYIGDRKATDEMYINYVKDQAYKTVLSTQVLYAYKASKIEDSEIWLESAICENLLFVGGAMEEFPELKNDYTVKNSLSLASQYSKDYSTTFCSPPSASIETEYDQIMHNAYQLSMSALSIANSSSEHEKFLSEYQVN